MSRKPAGIKELNIRAMICLIAFVDNDFIPTNAAIDLKTFPSEVSIQMKRIENSVKFDVFIRGKRKSSHTQEHITGMTQEGRLFYSKIKWFLKSIDIEHLLEMEILK